MKFTFGTIGFTQMALMYVVGLRALDHGLPLGCFDFEDNFIRFSTKGFWKGLHVINIISETLAYHAPDIFDPMKTNIWVDDVLFNSFLVDKLRVAEKGLLGASRLLRQGRSKKPEKSNEKTKRARLKLEETLRVLQLTA